MPEHLPIADKPPRLPDRVRAACRVRHYSIRTEDCYADWIRRFILFQDKRHFGEIGPPKFVGINVGRPAFGCGAPTPLTIT